VTPLSEQFFLESMPDGFIALDRDWVYTYVNAAAEKILRAKRETLLNRTLWECFPELADAQVRAKLQQAMDEKIAVEHEEYDAPRKTWLEVRAVGTDDGLAIYFRDISRRRRQEEALRISEERFRTLTENSTDLVTALDADGTILFASSSLLPLLGYRPEEVVGWNCLSLVHPDDRSPGREALRTELPGMPHHHRTVYRFRHKNGDWRWLESTATRQKERPGLGRYIVNSRDVTERRHAEEALRQSTRQRESLLESISDAFFGFDSEWRFTYVNRHGERLHSLPPGGLNGRNLWEVFPDLEATYIGQQYLKAMRERTPLHFEALYEPLRRWGSFRLYPTDDGGLSLFILDVTERHQAEETVRRSMVLLRGITEGTPDIVYVKDLDGKFLMINSVGARFLGAPIDEIVGKSCTLFFGPELVAQVKEAERRVLEKGEPETSEESLPYYGLMRTFLTVRAPYRGSDNSVLGMIGILRDITEQKALQNQLIRSDRLAAMGELVAGVAHELNNPLAAISGYAQLLKLYHDQNVKDDADGILQMTDRAARIVRSLLTFARQSDHQERGFHSLRSTVEETLEMLRYRLRDSDIETVVTLSEPDLLPLMNAGQIEQVLLNLLANAEYALRQRPAHRRITVTTRRVTEAGRAWAALSIADNGRGVPPEIQGRIFDPFFTTKEQGEGTGLGLSICHGIIEAHGGTITVESQPGDGATFTVRLPLGAEG
jgi:PAS domain S-box-containing protein